MNNYKDIKYFLEGYKKIGNYDEKSLKWCLINGYCHFYLMNIKNTPYKKEIKKTYPIVLLDDIFSELDIEKRNNLLKFIKSNIQFIITTTDIKNISEKIVEKASILKIKDGNIINYGRKKNYGTTKTL